MDLKELGRTLRQERERLKLSIAEVSESTRISRRILVVFEEGDEKNYPHPVYAKGFIRNYARALGLDPEFYVRAMEEELGTDHPDPEVHVGQKQPTLKDLKDPKAAMPKGRPIWPALLGALALAAVLGALIWYFSFYSPVETSEVQPDQTVVHEQHADAVKPGAEAPGGTADAEILTEAAEPPEAAAQDPAEAAEAAEGENTTLQASASAVESAAQAPAEAAADPGANNSGLNTLVIQVVGSEPCWVGVWIPGNDQIAKDFTVQGGASETYRFSGERMIRFGRAEAVKLTFNGKAQPLSGKGVVNITLP